MNEKHNCGGTFLFMAMKYGRDEIMKYYYDFEKPENAAYDIVNRQKQGGININR